MPGVSLPSSPSPSSRTLLALLTALLVLVLYSSCGHVLCLHLCEKRARLWWLDVFSSAACYSRWAERADVCMCACVHRGLYSTIVVTVTVMNCSNKHSFAVKNGFQASNLAAACSRRNPCQPLTTCHRAPHCTQHSYSKLEHSPLQTSFWHTPDSDYPSTAPPQQSFPSHPSS
jgi:hypothetical protein